MRVMGAQMNVRKKGFSLIEVIVGLAISMISMIVIMQVFAVFEGDKRTTTAGADAQNNGAIALYMIERDAKMAGWGMDSSAYKGCVNTFSYCDGSAECGGAAGPLPEMNFASLTLKDGGAGSDTISIHYFADPGESSFSLPMNTTIQKTMPSPSAELDVERVEGCEEGELLLVAQAGNCTLMQVTEVQDVVRRFQHNPGGSGFFNPPASYLHEHKWPAYTSGAKVSCFKRAPNSALFSHNYSINPATRQLVRAAAGVQESVASEIVDLQAQYGIAPEGGSQVVNEWLDARGAIWGKPDLVNAKRIKAIRVAIVSRSSQYERPKGGSCISTSVDALKKWPSWASFNTAGYGEDWQCYRYKVFETVIPLRNVLWGNL